MEQLPLELQTMVFRLLSNKDKLNCVVCKSLLDVFSHDASWEFESFPDSQSQVFLCGNKEKLKRLNQLQKTHILATALPGVFCRGLELGYDEMEMLQNIEELKKEKPPRVFELILSARFCGKIPDVLKNIL